MSTLMQRLAGLTLLLALVAPAKGAFYLYNTGVDTNGAVLADGTVGDPHYTLASVPGGSTANIRVRSAAGGYPIGPWLGDNALSRWIGPNNTSSLVSPPGTYVYQTTFDLAGYNPSTASITGQWSSDNDGVGIYLNGNLVDGATNFAQFTAWDAFSITSGFVPGLNTLQFIVHNGGNAPGNNSGGSNPTGLRVEMNGVATAVPEASSVFVFALTGVFAAGAVFFGRRHGLSL